MKIETILQLFIEEACDLPYYADYSVSGGEEVHALSDADLVELPFTPNELRQGYIKVWN
jgi:hypothetical protein